jgi:hypothetical protein
MMGFKCLILLSRIFPVLCFQRDRLWKQHLLLSTVNTYQSGLDTGGNESSSVGRRPVRDVRSVRCHRLAQSFFRIGSPVTAIEADEN